jgi:hypothetical protein
VNTNTPANQQPGTNQESELGRQVPGLWALFDNAIHSIFP